MGSNIEHTVRVRVDVRVRARVEDGARYTSQSFLSAASALVVLRSARFSLAVEEGLWYLLFAFRSLGMSDRAFEGLFSAVSEPIFASELSF